MTQPTAAHTRAWLAGAGALLIGVLVGRVDMLLLGLPFLLYALWAAVSRPESVPEVTPSIHHTQLDEGDALAYRITAPRWRGFVAMQVEGQRGLSATPEMGATVACGERATVDVQPERWGRYVVDVGPVLLTDALGAWQAASARQQLRLTVRPQSERIVGGSGVQRPIGMSGLHRSRARGEGTELSDVREFTTGDRLRRINWRVTSRLPGVHVNQMLTERDTDVLIVADSALDVGVAEGSSTLDALVRAITGVTRHYCAFGDRVAVHDLGARIGSVRSGTGNRQLRTVISKLARARSTGQGDDRVRRVRSLATGTLVFVCSPLMEADVIDEVVRLRNVGGEVVVIDTLPPDVGTNLDAFRADSFLAEAWALRRMQREHLVERLEAVGIPVVTWEGPGTLAAVLQAMEAARQAPRMRR